MTVPSIKSCRYLVPFVASLALSGSLTAWGASPDQQLADQFTELMRIQGEGHLVSVQEQAWHLQFQPAGPGRKEFLYFEQRLHELLDARFGGPPGVRYSREQHIEILNEALRKYHPATLEGLNRGDFGPDGFTGKPGGDPLDIILCDPGHPDNRGDGTAPSVPDKPKACADFYANYVEKEVAAPSRLKTLGKQIREIGEATEKAEIAIWSVSLEEWGNGGGPPGFDLPTQIRALMLKYHPEAAEACNNLIKGMIAGNISSVQNEAKRGLLGLWRAEQDFRDRDLDRNGVHDFWTADVSGLFRIHAEPDAQVLLDKTVAGSDDAPLPPGGTLGPGVDVPKTVVFHFHMVRSDGAGAAFAVDTDGHGEAWHNLQHFAICAYPAGYGRAAGRQTYLIDERKILWSKDTNGLVVDRFPKDPEAEGWSVAKEPEEPGNDAQTFEAPNALEREAPEATPPPTDATEQRLAQEMKRILFEMESVAGSRDLIGQLHLTSEQAAELVPRVVNVFSILNQGEVKPSRQEENLIEFLAEIGPSLTKASHGVEADVRGAVVNLLFSMIQDTSSKYAPSAAVALYRITGDSKPLRYLEDIYLMELTTEANVERGAFLINQLGRLGARATDSLPYLNYRLLNDSDERCRLAAACALARITGLTDTGGASLLGEIEGSLPSKGTPKDSGTAVDIRESMIAYTEDLGPLAQLATPILVRISESETTDVTLRISAAHALIRGGIGAQAGIAAFRKILLLRDQIATKMALDSVNDLGTLAIALVPEITAIMGSEDAEPEIRVLAALTLVRVSGSAKPGVAFIAENLVHSENSILTLECIRALGSLGVLGSDAVPVLNKLGESDENTERFAAVNEALREIDSGIITAEMH